MNGAPEWLWFLVQMIYVLISVFLTKKIEKSQIFLELRNIGELYNIKSTCLFVAMKQKKDDPLRRSRIIFSIIIALNMISFLIIPTMISWAIGVAFFR